MKKYSIKKWFALVLKLGLGVVVFTFLATESLNFFEYVFPDDQWFMAYTGLGLTSVAFLVYMYLFMFDAETELQKMVALGMIAVTLIGEILTAGFGMQIESWAKSGFEIQESDFVFMLWVIRILMFIHGIALFLFFGGDKIVEAFSDEDGDGIPNVIDKDYKRPN